jgi:hypothetical protein
MGSSPDEKDSKAAPREVPLEVVDDLPKGTQAGESFSGTPKRAGQRGASPFRFVVSLLIGALADWLEVMFPFAWLPIDCVTAALFFMLWGLRWETALVLVPELIPGLNMFPSWVLLAFYLGQKNRPPQDGPGQ